MTSQYSLEKFMAEIGRASDYSDLKTKLRLAMHDGTFLDGDEVMLILTALAHNSGVEKAFSRMFDQMFDHEDREQKD